MATLSQAITAHDIITADDLKLLASASGPCVTAIVEVRDPRERSIKLKNALRSIERKLTDEGNNSHDVQRVLEPIRGLANEVGSEGIWSNALAVYRSPNVFRYFLLYGRVPELESVEQRFQARPLFAALAREQRFHLLGLNRHKIRLLHCTQHRLQEENLRGLAARDIRDWLNVRQPDHVLDNRSTAGPSAGSSKGVMFGTSTDREREDEYLAHFYKAVDRSVNEVLRTDPCRLMLAGTETEVALYRRVTNYPWFFEEFVHGSAAGLTDAELHHHAAELVMRSRSESLERALADYARREPGRVSFDASAVVKAAFEGRVDDLFVAADAEMSGSWNEEMHQVETTGRKEDLLNAAALQTVLHGGRAFELEPHDMPSARDVVAVLRF